MPALPQFAAQCFASVVCVPISFFFLSFPSFFLSGALSRPADSHGTATSRPQHFSSSGFGGSLPPVAGTTAGAAVLVADNRRGLVRKSSNTQQRRTQWNQRDVEDTAFWLRLMLMLVVVVVVAEDDANFWHSFPSTAKSTFAAAAAAAGCGRQSR